MCSLNEIIRTARTQSFDFDITFLISMPSLPRCWLVLLGFFLVVNNHFGRGFSTTQRRRRRQRSSGGSDEIEAISRALQIIYRESGTLGVLRRSDGILEQYQATSLVEAAIVASRGSKGVASGILNAFLGAAVCSSEGGGNYAVQLMNAYDKLEEEYRLQPNLVALSLAYVATYKEEGHSQIAQRYLQRAEELYSEDVQQTQQLQRSTIMEPKPDVWSNLKDNHGIQLLQDQKEFVVLSKPSGMVCYHANVTSTKLSNKAQPRNKKRKNKSTDISLETCLLDGGVPLSTLNSQGRGMVHRIDRGTSGCIILAKTNSMHAKLLVQFFLKKQIKKSYQALVAVSPKQRQQIILPKEGCICVDIDGRPAESNYHLEQSFANGKVSRIRVQTEQGRRHQVRLHCAEGLSAPILLDPLYGGISAMLQLNAPAQELCRKIKAQKKFCLHANSLAIPDYGIDVEAPLPEWWQELEQLITIEHE
mmetsp:Transcript_11297/g.16596  ORF Transcript_11297/g.16596 Transcript_11297/m.16596 type:complete len:476 (+) Transcript_11297:12-1439(+)